MKESIGKYLAESILIIVSILLAFAIEAWWDFRKDQIEEKKLLSNLAVDFKQNRELLDFAMSRYSNTVSSCQELMDLIHPGKKVNAQQVPDSLLFQILLWHTYNPVVGTLNSAISSGRISLVENNSLRTELAIWDDLVRDMKESEKIDYEILTRTNEELFQYIPIRTYAYRNGATFLLRESTGSPDFQRLLGSMHLENLLSNRVAEMSLTLVEAGQVSQSLNRILQLLESELQ